MANTMINPSVIDLLKKVDDRYSLVILSSRRARKLIDGAPKLSKREGKKPLTIAINEVDEGIISYEPATDEE